MAYVKLIQHDVLKERHELTSLLRRDMANMKIAYGGNIDYYKGRMMGIINAYNAMGIIGTYARMRYINIINNASFKRWAEVSVYE